MGTLKAFIAFLIKPLLMIHSEACHSSKVGLNVFIVVTQMIEAIAVQKEFRLQNFGHYLIWII